MNFVKKLALCILLIAMLVSGAEAAKYKNLLDAVENGTVADIEQLLKAGADVNECVDAPHGQARGILEKIAVVM